MITDDEVRENVAENVNRFLGEKGWTQQDLADKSGESLRNIGRICRAENVVRVGLLARCAEALGVNLDRLIDSPPTPPQKNTRRSA